MKPIVARLELAALVALVGGLLLLALDSMTHRRGQLLPLFVVGRARHGSVVEAVAFLTRVRPLFTFGAIALVAGLVLALGTGLVRTARQLSELRAALSSHG